jgi:hypothetical protein
VLLTAELEHVNVVVVEATSELRCSLADGFDSLETVHHCMAPK